MKEKTITIENGMVSIPQSGEIWMTQWEIARLFDCFIAKISANVRAILKTGVLDEADVCRMHHFKNGNFVEQYNMEMVIALSFRVQTKNTEAFRKWLTRKLSKAEIPGMLIMTIKNPILN